MYEWFMRLLRWWRRFMLLFMTALLFFDVWVSWHLQQPPIGSNVWLAGFVFAWVWIEVLDRNDA